MHKISLRNFKHTLKDIYKNTDNRKFCFVLGAGASYKSGIPTGGELAEKWLKEIDDKHSAAELDQWEKEVKLNRDHIAAHYGAVYQKRFESDKNSGYEFLVQAMKNATPTAGHWVLAQILNTAPDNCVLTTNFDNLIETAIYYYTLKKPLVCGHESLSSYARPSTINPLIIKVHRDLLLAPKSNPDEISKLDKGWKEPLDYIFSSHIPIVIGYGGNDGSLMDYFEKMNRPSNFFWCGMVGTEPSERVITLLEQMNGRYIEIEGFDEMMRELLWVFDEIKPFEEELDRIAKIKKDAMNMQLQEMMHQSEHAQVTTPKKDNPPEISAFEYSEKAQSEPDYEKRKAIYLEALEHFPNTAWLWNAFTYFMHFIKNDYEKLEEYYQRALKVDPDHANNNGNYAIYLKELKKDYQNAEKYYLKALEIDPEHANNHGNYAAFLHDTKLDYENAEKHYLKALEIDPEQASNQGNYALYLKDVAKDYENAEKYYLKALEIDPKHANNQANYASYLKDIKDYENAEKHYLKALEIDPENANKNGSYANFLREVKKDYENAEKYYLKALEIDPENADGNGNFAQLLFILKRSKEAKKYLEKAFALNKDEESDLVIELWFYRYAHCPEYLEEAEKKLEELLAKGIQSVGWNLDENVKVAVEVGHPRPKKLKELAQSITTKQE
ncbi:MAG: tetratricopeptide repeat protein [Bacteroidota bacterium]